ncbi:MAG: two-component system response regulator, partial [Candidatus Rokuibacteriota bacterium]
RSAIGFARETLAALTRHLWPGNVRELEHAIERAVALSSTALILPDDLPADVRGPAETTMPVAPPARLTLEELKHWYVARILDEAGGNKARAAEMLGIDRRTLYRILARESEDGE